MPGKLRNAYFCVIALHILLEVTKIWRNKVDPIVNRSEDESTNFFRNFGNHRQGVTDKPAI